jgi:alkanesulfonate monooxygenase SsuD/methylene tetrahydromethanopterin reductase-like flavin-dependent oxidoreductase (luciferase family)
MTTAGKRRVRISIELPVHGVGFARVLELARAAEDAGLDGLWIPDHLVPLRPDGPFPLECWTLLAALAGATARIRVGPLVLVLPLRDPGLLALQARTLAAVAPGRVVLGIGLGGFTYRRAAASLGITTHDLATRGDVLGAALQRLRAALPADDATAPRPELWVGGRSRSALDAAVRAADGWNCPFAAEIEPRLRDLDAACAAAGREPRTLARSVYALAAVASTEDEARRRAASAAAMAKLFGDVEREHVFGTPVRAAERLRAFAALGIEEVALHLAGSHAERLDAIALLGREVLPLL